MGLFPDITVFGYIRAWNCVACLVHFAVAIYVLIGVGLGGVNHPTRAYIGTQR